ncbi:hypothetical protein [Methanoplanus endosymbiosus]|uniref:Uncharacterized protein n=1 Tax=Methanoplanus endosymbiosus TaxID=33865 RepID=A0A9E7PLC6_9EURY|nr:hypothetical protein [Methanoplanus endosymbiosus]UUX91457.1 hypothetical protein L6E24_08720 [Methanoplanus endosymbiosus]
MNYAGLRRIQMVARPYLSSLLFRQILLNKVDQTGDRAVGRVRNVSSGHSVCINCPILVAGPPKLHHNQNPGEYPEFLDNQTIAIYNIICGSVRPINLQINRSNHKIILNARIGIRETIPKLTATNPPNPQSPNLLFEISYKYLIINNHKYQNEIIITTRTK